jgi:hypothetical protein
MLAERYFLWQYLFMEEEPVLREALSRRDAALAEARRLDEFVRMYNELRGRPSLSVVGDAGKSDGVPNEFMLDKSRPNIR